MSKRSTTISIVIVVGVVLGPMPAKAQKIYWTEISANVVKRANLDGSEIETIVSGASSMGSVAVDAAGGKVYWTDTPGGVDRFHRANLDGSDAEVLFGDCSIITEYFFWSEADSADNSRDSWRMSPWPGQEGTLVM